MGNLCNNPRVYLVCLSSVIFPPLSSLKNFKMSLKNESFSLMLFVVAGPPVTVTLAVHDSQVPCIVGKAGATIKHVQMITGAKMKLSQRGEFIAGTQNRTLTITGSSQSCTAVQNMISQILASQMTGQAQYASATQYAS